MRDWLKERTQLSETDNNKFKDWEQAIATAVFIVEKECSQQITWNYPLMKFYSLLDEIYDYYKKQKAEMDKIK